MDDEAARHAYERVREPHARLDVRVTRRRTSAPFQQIGNQEHRRAADVGSSEPTALVTGSSVVVAEGSADEPVAHALADHLTGSGRGVAADRSRASRDRVDEVVRARRAGRGAGLRHRARAHARPRRPRSPSCPAGCWMQRGHRQARARGAGRPDDPSRRAAGGAARRRGGPHRGTSPSSAAGTAPTHSGAATARNATDHSTAASTGCCERPRRVGRDRGRVAEQRAHRRRRPR